VVVATKGTIFLIVKHLPVRTMADVKEPLVLFLIGMRINTIWRVWEWLPSLLAMGPMIVELYKNPELGFLSARTELAGRTITVVQYWKSFEALEAYAANSERKHRPAWTAFYKRATTGTGAVGIYHETYVIHPGQVESLYADMPANFGLGGVVGMKPVTSKSETARERKG
jgi:hypothetical protein